MTDDPRPDPYAGDADLYDVLWAGLSTIDLSFHLSIVERYGGPLLELACGTGRVLLPCAKVAGKAVGVDLSPAMLAQARARVAAEGLDSSAVRLVEGDMCTVRLDETFPLVTMGGQPMFHLSTDEQWLATMATVRAHLAPGGRWLAMVPVPRFDGMAEYDGRQYLVGELRHPVTGRRTLLWDHNSYDIAEQSVTRRRLAETLDEDGLVVERRYSTHRNYYRYPGEVRRLLEAGGFRLDEVYGDHQRNPYGPASKYFIWVATAAD
jgi:SAM-dependent methyltransferase